MIPEATLKESAMYRAYALLQPNSNFDLGAAVQRLQASFPGMDVKREGDLVTLTGADWDYSLKLEQGEFVLGESQGFAERIAGAEDGLDIASCDRRVEMWSDTPDPFMEHCDDHLKALEAVRGFSGIILIDPSEPCIL